MPPVMARGNARGRKTRQTPRSGTSSEVTEASEAESATVQEITDPEPMECEDKNLTEEQSKLLYISFTGETTSE